MGEVGRGEGRGVEKKKCVAQAGLELVILLPLPPSANPTGVRHHNRRPTAAKLSYSNRRQHDDTPNHMSPPSRNNNAQRTLPNTCSQNTRSQRTNTHTRARTPALQTTTLTRTLTSNTKQRTPEPRSQHFKQATPLSLSLSPSLSSALQHYSAASLPHSLPPSLTRSTHSLSAFLAGRSAARLTPSGRDGN